MKLPTSQGNKKKKLPHANAGKNNSFKRKINPPSLEIEQFYSCPEETANQLMVYYNYIDIRVVLV